MATPGRPLSGFFLLSLLSLHRWPPGTSQCHRGRGVACSAPPAPGTHLLGTGLDVTTLEATGGQVLLVGATAEQPGATGATCLLCRDLLAGGRARRLPPGVGGWRSGRRCRQGTTVATGSRAVGKVAAGREEVARGWRAGLGGAVGRASGGTVAVAGSHSRAAEFGLRRQREDRYAFASLHLRCVLYWTWVSPSARPSPHFLRAVRALPPNFTRATAADYEELLATYGTHYIRGAQLGGRLRALTAIRSCRAAMAGASAQEVADCLGVEVTAGGGAVRAGLMAAACRRARGGNQGNASFNEAYAERLVEVEGGDQHGDLLYGRPEAYSRWLRSLPAIPGLVAADVRPLHTLLPHGEPRRKALRAAVGHYVAWRALRLNCSRVCPGGHLAGPCQCGCPADAALTPDCCSRHRGTGRLTVTVWGGGGWRGDHLSPTDAYVRVTVGSYRARTPTVWNEDRPRWGARLVMGRVALPPGARLRLEVWDEDNGWDDDLLGVCEVGLEATPGGNDNDADDGQDRPGLCYPGGGRLEFGYRLTCGRALGGPLCHDYVPQPPEGDGGLYRFSRWPPGPTEGPIAWPEEEEEEEEEEEDDLQATPEATVANGSLMEAPEMEVDFGEEEGNPLGEATEAFGQLPEPLGDFGDGPLRVRPPAGFKKVPRGHQDPALGSKEVPQGHQDPSLGFLGGSPELEPSLGSKKVPQGHQDPSLGSKNVPQGHQDPSLGSKEVPQGHQDPSLGSKKVPQGHQDPSLGSKKVPQGHQDPALGSKKVPQGHQDPSLGSKEVPQGHQDPPLDFTEGSPELDPASGFMEGPPGHQDPSLGSKKVPQGHQDPPLGSKKVPQGHQDPSLGSKKVPQGHRDPPLGPQKVPPGPAPLPGRGEGPPAP